MGKVSSKSIRLFVAIAVLCSFNIFAQAHPPANHEKVLYAFPGGSDGFEPNTLLRDSQGNLYGTTSIGGNANGNCNTYRGCGVVFELTAAGKYSVLHKFDWNDGIFPDALVQDTNGDFYGITVEGDNSACFNGCGVIFKLTKAGDFTLLYSFTGGSDGSNPSSLIMDAAGNLYGTAQTSSGDGEIFELTAADELKVLYAFSGKDGSQPDHILRDRKGNIYGTTFQGGAHAYGTVFKLDSSGKETLLYSFKGKSDGTFPDNIARDKAGNLYGTTAQGGYEKGKCDLPHSPVGCGTVFKINTSGKFSVLFAFNSVNGNDPDGLILDAKGNLYGATMLGGTGNYGCSGGNCDGVVFKLAAGTDKESTLYNFTGKSDGYFPSGALVEDSNHNLYGTTVYGGKQSCGGNPGCGVIFEIPAD